MDRLRLVTIGDGIHAAFYKRGQWIGEGNLGREADVRVPTAEELADRPEDVPDFAERTDRGFWSSFSGFYVVPDRGLAAVFGAVAAAPPSRRRDECCPGIGRPDRSPVIAIAQARSISPDIGRH
jgi:hypothetical protein